MPLGTSKVGWDIDVRGYGLTTGSSADQSAAVQTAINDASATAASYVILPPGTIYCKALELPNNVTLKGQGIGATTLKLVAGANVDLIETSTYRENQTFANTYGGLRDLTLDGNSSNNSSGSLLVFKSYRINAERVQFTNAALHGVLYTEFTQGGASNANGEAENKIHRCFFEQNNGAGVYAHNGSGNRISDGFIIDNVFYQNGSSGFYQIDLERSAGFHICGNHMYNGALGDLRSLAAAALVVSGNNFDGTTNAVSGDYVRQVLIAPGGWGMVTVQGNIFHNRATSLGSATGWRQLEINATVNNGISVANNNFYSQTLTVKSIVNAGLGSICLSGNSYSSLCSLPT